VLTPTLAILLSAISFSGCASPEAQGRTTAPPAAASQAATSEAPATKIESFKPVAGSIVTFGYDELGELYGISLDVRELRDARGAGARGVLVEITESQYRKERSFVDADEIPELLKGFDAIVAVKENPTTFKNFEVRYTTRGSLQLTAFNPPTGVVQFAVQVGATLKAQRVGLGVADMQKLRAWFAAALTKLNSLGPLR
jgi:hypothetical protein